MFRLSRRLLTVLSIILAALLGATLLTAASQATTGSTTASTTSTAQSGRPETNPGGAKPTVVLVHGGWADSSGWYDEIAALQRKGYPVIAPANPLARPDLRRRLRP